LPPFLPVSLVCSQYQYIVFFLISGFDDPALDQGLSTVQKRKNKSLSAVSLRTRENRGGTLHKLCVMGLRSHLANVGWDHLSRTHSLQSSRFGPQN
jgi:hypothetical protein